MISEFLLDNSGFISIVLGLFFNFNFLEILFFFINFEPMKVKIGLGYDVHRFADQRDLILAGVKIPYTQGLLGHSDADVVLHAVCDALLGAAGLPDIGFHFPPSDPSYKDIDSKILLKKVFTLIQEKKYQVNNLDITVLLEKPKIAPYVLEMRKNIAAILEIPLEDVNIKATTTEKLGYEGRGEGATAMAVVLLIQQ